MSRVSKVKISLASGNFIEKPVVTCFKGNNATYLILDNEANGQMGYPIICITRLNNNVAEKISDEGEWTAVKENLRTIIGGTTPVYVAVPEGLTAQDDFYKQLTLPVASFDVLKNTYVVPAEAPATPEAPVAPVPVEPTPLEAPQATSIPTPAPNIGDATVINAEPVVATTEPVATPTMEAPMAIPLPNNPETPTPMVSPLPVTNPGEAPSPVTLDAPVITQTESTDDIQILKDSFMKSCENMFDALIKKFENK